MEGLNLADAAAGVTEDLLDSYETDKNTLADFKEQFAAMVEKKTEPKEGEERKPLIVMIDELDRCRPPFAVELLEKVKHLFSVPNVIFVLGIDNGQLAHSVKTLYGTDMDAPGYLRRFIDLEYRLDITDDHGLSEYLMKKYKIEEALASIGFRDNPFHWELKWLFGELSQIWGLSVRDRERLAIQLQLSIRSMGQKSVSPFLLGVVLALQFRRGDDYEKLLQGELTFGKLVDDLKSRVASSTKSERRNTGKCLGHIMSADFTKAELGQQIASWNRGLAASNNGESNDTLDGGIQDGLSEVSDCYPGEYFTKERVLKVASNIGKFTV